MFDMHYDLLTLILMANRTQKDISHFLTPLNKSNVKGITANLYFMSKEEMENELKYPKEINVLAMFKQAKQTLESYNLDCNILYSIEGCDYIRDTKELEELSKEGLNSILLVWNNPNKYGSGIRSNKGLTEEGKQFIQKAIDLKLGIDLSHTNELTFNEIIKIIKENQTKGKQVICYASHSNIKNIQNNPRNLNDNQLQQLKEVGGYLGLVAYRDFLSNSNDLEELKKAYIKHIIYAANILGIDKVTLASDNMYFINEFDTYQEQRPVYDYNKMNKEIREGLKQNFNEIEINKIMYENAYRLYKQLKNN